MKTKRHREVNPPLNAEPVYYYKPRYQNNLVYWDWHSYGSDYPSPYVQHTVQIMDDYVTKGERSYNDCLNRKRVGEYRVFNVMGLQTRIQAVKDGSTNALATAWNASCGMIVEAAKPFLPMMQVAPPYSTIVEQVRGSSSLPRTIEIDRDPFDTGFSVWFLLVDLFSFKAVRKTANAAIQAVFNTDVSDDAAQDALKAYRGKLRKRKVTKLSRRRLFRTRSGTVRTESAKQFADTHLGIRFGILPFVKDVQEFLKLINKWKDLYDQVGLLLTKRYRAHSNKEWADPPWLPDGEQTITFAPFFNSGSIDLTVKRTTRVTWHGLTLYGFSCPEFQGWLSRLKQISDAFGIFDPAALWDVIPFSFIVDWFFSVSTWLHKNRPRWFPASVVIHDYLETVRIDTRYEYSIRYMPTYSSVQEASYVDHVIGIETETYYDRRRYRPTEDMVRVVSRAQVGHMGVGSAKSRPTSMVTLSNRASIVASLVAQRVPR